MASCDNICRFIPTVSGNTELTALNFVCERGWAGRVERLQASYRMCLVTAGSAVLTCAEREVALSPGTLFFTFSAKKFVLVAGEGFEFLYVSFLGSKAVSLLERAGARADSPVFTGFDALVPVWQDALLRAGRDNLDLVTLSLVYDVFSRLSTRRQTDGAVPKSDGILQIKAYVDEHFADPAVDLGTVSVRFGYSPKYVSVRFKKAVGLGFNNYLTQRRLEYGRSLLCEGMRPISYVAQLCGYGDPLYFSKAYKKRFGLAPRDEKA